MELHFLEVGPSVMPNRSIIVLIELIDLISPITKSLQLCQLIFQLQSTRLKNILSTNTFFV